MTEFPISIEGDASHQIPTGERRDGQYYDPVATPEPQGEWDYELDDDGVIYGVGPWPFWRARPDIIQLERRRVIRKAHRLMHLVPNVRYRARERTHNVTLLLGPRELTAYVTFEVFVRAQAAGGIVQRIDARLAISSLTWEWTKEPDASIAAAAELKRDKVLQFLRRAIEERDRAMYAPVTARQRYLASRIRECH